MATMATANTNTLFRRIESYRVSKSVMLLACLACVAVTIFMGFTRGGWVTSAKATGMANQASGIAQANLAATICADRFITAPNAQAETALLKWTEAGQRSDFMRQGGWLALPGMNEPVAGAAELCVQKILGASPPAN
jgi:hypothetical protein